jgi:hypothetical protein
MRSATTSGGIAAATWYQQTPGAPVTGTVTLNQYAQVEIRFDTSDGTEIPITESFKVTWYTGAQLLKPCAYIFNREYCLNLADVGQAVNNIVWRYNVPAQFFLPRTGRGNNVYFIDEGILLSGTSASDGYVRKNEIGATDDGTDISHWFITKNVYQNGYENVIKRYKTMYTADQPWTLSYSTDGGTTWTDLTIPASGIARSLDRSIPGLALAEFAMLKCSQSVSDTNWSIEQIGLELEQGYKASDD